ncbi:MAG TPA: hypothetical protein VIJ95_00585 [Hanamia sp.]
MPQHQNTYNTNGTSEEASQSIFTKRFQSRSQAAQEIISHQPTFLEKWALLLFLAILILLIAGTWFIRYPDIIEASGRLTADNAPKEIVPLQSGRLIKLFVKNDDKIKKDEMIGWMESTANTSQILALSAKLDSSLSLMSQGNSENVSGLFNESYQSLGELQVNRGEIAFYLSNRLINADEAHQAVINHWGIENRNHYVRDVSLQEDNSRIRKNAFNISVLRSLAINIFRKNSISNIKGNSMKTR